MMGEPFFLTLDDLIVIHANQIANYGGCEGIRSQDLLDSAVAMPQSAFGGEYLHAGIHEMAAAYLFYIVKNHPFVDGNKRAGTVACLVFLECNGLTCTASNDDLADFTLKVADGRCDKTDATIFLRTWTVLQTDQ